MPNNINNNKCTMNIYIKYKINICKLLKIYLIKLEILNFNLKVIYLERYYICLFKYYV